MKQTRMDLEALRIELRELIKERDRLSDEINESESSIEGWIDDSHIDVCGRLADVQRKIEALDACITREEGVVERMLIEMPAYV